MKYVLAKDSLLGRAGTMIVFNHSHDGEYPKVYLSTDHVSDVPEIEYISDKEDWDALIRNGWVEEAQSRVYYIRDSASPVSCYTISQMETRQLENPAWKFRKFVEADIEN